MPTSFATCMKMDGLLETFMETNLEPLPKFRRGEHRPPVNVFRSAAIAEIEEAPEGCRTAEVMFFNDLFFRNMLPHFFTDAAAMALWAKEIAKPKVGIARTHSLLRQVACPVEDGPGMIEWLYDLFVAFQAVRYSPNGEALDFLDPDVEIDHASMTVGDVVKVGSHTYMIGIDGIHCVQIDDPEPSVVRVEDFFTIQEQQDGVHLEEGDQSTSPTSTSDATGSYTSLDDSEDEEELKRHYAMYMAPDESWWCRPKDRRGLRAELSQHRQAMEAGQACKNKDKYNSKTKTKKNWQPKILRSS